jgi:hypothetical protein
MNIESAVIVRDAMHFVIDMRRDLPHVLTACRSYKLVIRTIYINRQTDFLFGTQVNKLPSLWSSLLAFDFTVMNYLRPCSTFFSAAILVRSPKLPAC